MRKTLEKLSIAGAMDRAFDLYRAHFGQFFRLSLATVAPYSILVSLVSFSIQGGPKATPGLSPEQQAEIILNMLGPFTIIILVALLGTALSYATASHMAAEAYMGRTFKWSTSVKQGLKATPRLIGAGIAWSILVFIVYILAVIPVGIVLGMITAIGSAAGPGPVAVIIIATGIVGVVFLVLSIAFSTGIFLPQLITLEGAGPINAIMRNWSLFSPQPMRLAVSIAGQMMAIQLLSIAMTSSIEGAAYLLTAGAPALEVIPKIISVVTAVTIGVLWQPFACTWLTILYFDRRVRLEGYDVTLATFAVQESPIPPSSTPSPA